MDFQVKRKAILIGEGGEFNELKAVINSNPQSSITFVEHIEVNSPLLSSATLGSLRSVLEANTISVLVVDVKSEKVVPLLPFFYNLVEDGVSIYDVTDCEIESWHRMISGEY